ncbi:hypothetical protein [Mycoplasma marinum]|uniref:Uncharacterized protein n=1 Tax=Mycoplasma marinum TaxID=1937190 RepID=A0A4R0XUA5_9MOLU|nr:hypothetical protein [Mycoplasma marinum]TCG10441.1 hypothetical protein C4B24_04635 [Mycoplasma marinum]
MIKENTRKTIINNQHLDVLIYHISNGVEADENYQYRNRVISGWFDGEYDTNKQFKKMCLPLVKIKKHIFKYAEKEALILKKQMNYFEGGNLKKINKITRKKNKQIVFKWNKEIIFISDSSNSIYTYALHQYAVNNFNFLITEIISKWNEISDLKWTWKHEKSKKRYLDFFIKY